MADSDRWGDKKRKNETEGIISKETDQSTQEMLRMIYLLSLNI